MAKEKTKEELDAFLNCTCPICGKRFHLKPFKLAADKNHYCSRECFRISKIETMKGEKNHQYGLRGELNSSWKGGRKISGYGYISIYSPDHPFCDNQQYVSEHRLVAEKYLLTDENSVTIDGKKYLKPEYDVHHIDFDRRNNKPENLMVLTRKEHKSLHAKLNKRKRDIETGRWVSMNDIRVSKITKSAILPQKSTDGSAGYDMHAELQEPLVIEPHRAVMIRSGVRFSIPKGYAGFIFARSGMAINFGIRPTTCVSVIDSDYRGEVGLPVRNDSDKPVTIYPGDRIAQIVFSKVCTPTLVLVDSFDNDKTERGSNGFGSTGR